MGTGTVYDCRALRLIMKFGLIRVKQHNGLDGLLYDRANEVFCHKDGSLKTLVGIAGRN